MIDTTFYNAKYPLWVSGRAPGQPFKVQLLVNYVQAVIAYRCVGDCIALCPLSLRVPPFTRRTCHPFERHVSRRPGFWLNLKWAWIQYLSVLLIFIFLFGQLKQFVFQNQLIPTVCVRPFQTPFGKQANGAPQVAASDWINVSCSFVCLSVSLSLLYLYHILFPVLVLSRSPLSTITVLHLVAQSLHLLANYPTRKQYTKTITPKIPVVLLNLFTIRFIPRYLVSRLFFEYFVWYFIIGNWLKYFTVLY